MTDDPSDYPEPYILPVPELDLFTERARQVLNLAETEAIRLGHNYIGPEHLLLGLAREEESRPEPVSGTFGDTISLGLADIREAIGRLLFGHFPACVDALERAKGHVLGAETNPEITQAVDTLRRLAPDRLAHRTG